MSVHVRRGVCVREWVAGKISVHGWLYVMETGDLLTYDSVSGSGGRGVAAPGRSLVILAEHMRASWPGRCTKEIRRRERAGAGVCRPNCCWHLGTARLQILMGLN